MDTEKSIFIAFILNFTFSLFELAGGIFTNSIAILSDALHDMADAVSIAIAFFLEKKSKLKPDETFTFGYTRYSVLGSTVTSLVLISGSVLVVYNAVNRLIDPSPINYKGMIIFAVIGVIVNSAAAFVTHKNHSLNQKAVNLHMLEDVLGWLVVLIGAIIMFFTDIAVLDPLMSMAVAIFILVSAVKNLNESIQLFLEKAPCGIDAADIKNIVSDIEGVVEVNHIHLWSLDEHNVCATMHITPSGNTNEIKANVRKNLTLKNINHITIETELPDDYCSSNKCTLSSINPKSGHHHKH